MKTHFLKKMLTRLFVIGAGLALLGTAAIANPLILDWRVIGTGTMVTTSCPTGLTSACTITTMMGTVLGQHVGSGNYNLTLTTGADNNSSTNLGGSEATNSSGGKCFPANGSGTITAANASTIMFK